MRSTKLLLNIAVLGLCALACRAVISAEPTPTLIPSTPSMPTPTPEAVQLPTETEPALPPTVTPTEEPLLTPTPTEQMSAAPVIHSVDLEEESSDDGMIVNQVIHFQDVDGDANYVDYELVSASIEDVLVEGSEFDIPPEDQKSGDTVTGSWECGSDNYEVTLRAYLQDEAGNQSEAVEYTIICGGGADLEMGFPDAFDDNRNGWDLDRFMDIQNGALQFRNAPEDKAYWTNCTACQVTEDDNKVSVDVSWSNTATAAIGLLVDNGTCNLDGLVFVVAPQGYYAVIQAVRDDDGAWRHWRPFVDWKKSNLIRRSQDTENQLSAMYEFSDELHVSLYINGTRVTRVRVYGYNGSTECLPGLFADGGLDANFDNFDITAE